ncbi:MAG: putative toxin-antitoxin system toxin component, PIN family [Saprospiraceae bacterium]
MENNRVVVDTNVFISAVIGQYSYPYKIFDELILTGDVVICFSPVLLKEYEDVSQRGKFKNIPNFTIRASN